MADVIRAELLEIIKRIELPYAEPAFGTQENSLNIRKALLSGYFMQVSTGVELPCRVPQERHMHGRFSQRSHSNGFLTVTFKDLVFKYTFSQARVLYINFVQRDILFPYQAKTPQFLFPVLVI